MKFQLLVDRHCFPIKNFHPSENSFSLFRKTIAVETLFIEVLPKALKKFPLFACVVSSKFDFQDSFVTKPFSRQAALIDSRNF